MAGPEDPAHARRGPGQLVEVGTAAGCGLGLGEAEGRHAERPVGVDELIQFVRACGREALPVPARAVRARREDVQGGLRLLLGHLAEQSVERGEQPLLVARVPDEESDVPAGAVGQGLPGRDRQRVRPR